MRKEYDYYFKPFKVGDMTDKGIIDDLFFLTFNGNCTAFRSNEPRGKGILIAEINGKDIPIGELKLVTR